MRTRSSRPCLKTVAACFGADILSADGTLDRKLLAQRAFATAENTALLGELVHPFVTAVLFRRLKQAQGLVVYDAPQLFEANGDAICDCVIAVVADEAVRRERIISRDGLSPEQADARIKAQHSEAFFRQNADHIIENNADEATLRQTAARVLCAVKQEVR